MAGTLDALEARWSSGAGAPEQDLLRLAILREAATFLHAGLSQTLASPRPAGEAARDARWGEGLSRFVEEDASLSALRSHRGSLAELLEALARRAPSALAGSRPSIAALDVAGSVRIPARVAPKLARYDRRWEQRIAEEGARLGWNLWELEAELPILEVEGWHRGLGADAWPVAIVLLLENVSFGESAWRGRWFLSARPELDSEARLRAERERLRDPRILSLRLIEPGERVEPVA